MRLLLPFDDLRELLVEELFSVTVNPSQFSVVKVNGDEVFGVFRSCRSSGLSCIGCLFTLLKGTEDF